jgi:RNA polymerase sigma-70 factor, ECF subfamily
VGRLEAAISSLPPRHRAPFILSEVQQLSASETAAILGITEAAVEARLRRAWFLLRAAIAAAPGESLPQAFAFVAPRCRRVIAHVMTAIEDRRDFDEPD